MHTAPAQASRVGSATLRKRVALSVLNHITSHYGQWLGDVAAASHELASAATAMKDVLDVLRVEANDNRVDPGTLERVSNRAKVCQNALVRMGKTLSVRRQLRAVLTGN